MKTKSKTIVLMSDEEILSVEESFSQIIESTSDRYTYRIKGVADTDYVEVGIANAEKTELLLVNEDAVIEALNSFDVDEIVYSRDLVNNDKFVAQYEDVADYIYNYFMPEGYCSHACEIGCEHVWTHGLIRWLDAKLGTELVEETEQLLFEESEYDIGTTERTGAKTNYYNIEPNEDGFVDVDRICNQLNLTFAEGNVLKSLFGIAIQRLTGEARHSAAGSEIDCNKFKHYAEQVCRHE